MSTKGIVCRKEIYTKGHLYVVTRRIIQRKTSTVLRVRIRAFKGGSMRGEPQMNEYTDYGHLGEGDAAFHRIVANVHTFQSS